jgi:hypothetical protein
LMLRKLHVDIVVGNFSVTGAVQSSVPFRTGAPQNTAN